MILTEYNEEFHLKMLREEYKEEGLREGRTEGLKEGFSSAQKNINLLNSKLIEQNRLADLKRAAVDSDYQNQLLKEFQLDDL